MIGYHFSYDVFILYGRYPGWLSNPFGYIWQQSVCWTFFLLSGFCFRLGRKPLKRGLIVFGGGLVVTAVTCIAMPESRIFWGVLTCLGSCMILLTPLEKVLRKIPSGLGLAISFGLFALLRNVPVGSLGFEKLVLYPLPVAFYRNLFTAYLGFPPQNFFSADYFPLIPWFFLFTAGYFLFRFLNERNLNERLFARGEVPVLSWLGRNSLIVYLLHQPVLYGLCLLFF
jgi:uncharacterized membrane protein